MKANKKVQKPWVTLTKDTKSGAIKLTRRGEPMSMRLEYPWQDGDTYAALVLDGEENQDSAIALDTSDLEWLMQAVPEMLSEMERAGVNP